MRLSEWPTRANVTINARLRAQAHCVIEGFTNVVSFLQDQEAYDPHSGRMPPQEGQPNGRPRAEPMRMAELTSYETGNARRRDVGLEEDVEDEDLGRVHAAEDLFTHSDADLRAGRW